MPRLHVNVPHAPFAVLSSRPFIDCSDDNADVRERASKIPGYIQDNRATLPLCSMLKSKNKDDRINALQTLEKIGGKIITKLDPIVH
jgi:hypothetical protein